MFIIQILYNSIRLAVGARFFCETGTVPAWRKDGDFQLSARALTAVWGAKPKQRQQGQNSSPSGLVLQQLLCQQRCLLSSPLPSHAKAPVCVKQTQLYLPLRPGGQSSDTQSVPKVRRLNWGAALQFHSVYTLYPKNAIYMKAGSHNSYFFLILPNQKLYCTWDYQKASCKGNYFKCAPLSPFTVDNVAHWNWQDTILPFTNFHSLVTRLRWIFSVTRKTQTIDHTYSFLLLRLFCKSYCFRQTVEDKIFFFLFAIFSSG